MEAFPSVPGTAKRQEAGVHERPSPERGERRPGRARRRPGPRPHPSGGRPFRDADAGVPRPGRGGDRTRGGPVIWREVAIAGIGQTAYAKALPASAWELAVEAILAALADAGVDPKDVDGLCRFAPPFEPVSEPQLVRALGIRELRFFAQSPLGGEALGAVIAHAAAAVQAGLARTVVVYRALSQSSGGRFGRADGPGPGPGGASGAGGPGANAHVVVPEEDNRSFAWPYGLMSPGQLFA